MISLRLSLESGNGLEEFLNFSLSVCSFYLIMPLPRRAHHSHTYLCHAEGCGRTFRNRSGLTKHFNTFHLASPSPPPSPPASFRDRQNLDPIFEDLQEAIGEIFPHHEATDFSEFEGRDSHSLYVDTHPLLNGKTILFR